MKNIVSTDHIKVIKSWLSTGSINIFGPPFAGKDTQGHYLVELLDAAPLTGGGDILRSSTIPKHVKKIMERGELIPTKDYIEIVLPYLNQTAFAGKPLVLSAVGRWHGEEEGVLKVTNESHHPLKAVIFLNLSEAHIWDRWMVHNAVGNRGARQDDAKESLEVRLKEFREKTMAVIDFYRKKEMLIEVDGNQEPQKVFGDIINKMFEFAQSKT